MTTGNIVEADAVGMVRSIAGIAQEEDVLSIRQVANGAWPRGLLLFFTRVVYEPCLEVELLRLFPILDLVRRKERSCGFETRQSPCQLSKASPREQDANRSSYLRFGHTRPLCGKLGGKWGSCLLVLSIPADRCRAENDRKLRCEPHLSGHDRSDASRP